MNPLIPILNPLIPILITYGLKAVLDIIAGWKSSGQPTEEEIKALFIDIKPEDYFKK